MSIFNENSYIHKSFKLYRSELAKKVIRVIDNELREMDIITEDGERYIYDSSEDKLTSLPLSHRDITKEVYCKEFARRLDKVMRICGYDQKKLSEETGIPYRTINSYLTGKKTASIYNVRKMAAILQCNVNYFTNF